MKSLITIVFVCACLSLIGLCSTASHAANNNLNIQSNINKTERYTQIKALPVFKLNGNNNTLVAVNYQTNINTNNNNLFDKYTESPLLILSNKTLSNIALPLQRKQQSFFEMFAIFNDKLQSFLSYFKSSEKVEFMDDSKKMTPSTKVNCNK